MRKIKNLENIQLSMFKVFSIWNIGKMKMNFLLISRKGGGDQKSFEKISDRKHKKIKLASKHTPSHWIFQASNSIFQFFTNFLKFKLSSFFTRKIKIHVIKLRYYRKFRRPTKPIYHFQPQDTKSSINIHQSQHKNKNHSTF